MPGKGKKGKGGKKKRRGKKNTNAQTERKLLISDGPCQQYAQALKALGDRRFMANCYDPTSNGWEEKVIHVRGAFRKRVWVNEGTFVLISTRDFDTQDGTTGIGGDVIYVYNDNEVKKLRKMGEFHMEEDEESSERNFTNQIEYLDSEESNSEAAEESKKDNNSIVPQQRNLDLPPESNDSEFESDTDDLQGMLDGL